MDPSARARRSALRSAAFAPVPALALALALALGVSLLGAPPGAASAGAPAGARSGAPSAEDDAPLVGRSRPDTARYAWPSRPRAARAGDARLARDYPRLPARCATFEELIPRRPMTCKLRWTNERLPTLVLWGDSHLWQLLPAIRSALRGQRVNLVAFFFGNCVPAKPDMAVWGSNPCAQTADKAVRFIDRLDRRGRDVRVLLGSLWGANLNRLYYYLTPEYAAEMKRRRQYVMEYTRPLFTWLGQRGVPTDVVVQGPQAVPPRPNCRPGPTPFHCDIKRSHAYYKEAYVTGWLRQQMRRLPRGARLVDYSDAVCGPRVCRAKRAGIHTWFDPYHISASRAATLTRFFVPTVRALVRSR